MPIEMPNSSHNQQIAANILTQSGSVADQDISSCSTFFIVTECILVFFTVGIVTGIMEACRYFISQPKVHAEFTAGILNISEAINQLNRAGDSMNIGPINICGVRITIQQEGNNSKLNAFHR